MMPSDVQIMGAADDVQIMGSEPATDYVSIIRGFGAASTPAQIACAEKEKAPLYLAAGCTLGTVGTGLFGVYKLFKGKPAAGVTAMVGAGLLYVVGAAFAKSAALQFENCVKGGPSGIT